MTLLLMSAQPTKAPCHTSYRAAHDSGIRSHPPTLIVLHSTEGDTAESAAAWFENPRSAGSAHLCVDDNECFRTLDDNVIPWAAPGANSQGYHIEQAGYAHWTRAEWLQHRATIRRAAYKAALRCKKYKIPAVWLTPADLKAGKHGITSHANCTIAFGGDHTDPGSDYPRAYFMARLRSYLKGM